MVNFTGGFLPQWRLPWQTLLPTAKVKRSSASDSWGRAFSGLSAKKQLQRTLNAVAILLCMACNSAFGQADLIDRDSLRVYDRVIFRSGAEMQGEILEDGLKEDAIYLVFKKLDGSILKIDKARLVEKIYKLDPIDVQYNQQLESLKDTAESHHQMAEWIKDQKGRFKDQLQFHLERIMALDPNDARVRAELGYQLLKNQSRWVPKELYWDTIGFERQGTSWWPKLYREVQQAAEKENAELAQRKSAFSSWLRKIKNPRYSKGQLVAELQAICDEYGVLIIYDEAKTEKDPEIRRAYINAIGSVPTYAAMQALVFFAIEDEVLGSRALDLLKQAHYDRQQVAARIAHPTEGYLTSKSNVLLQRAAFAIGELDSESAHIPQLVLPLADALITTHVIAPADHPDRKQAGFSNNGVQNFQFGGNSKPTKLTVKNRKVLDALEKITGQKFGFAADLWKQWYIERYTHYDLPVRGNRR